MYEFVGNDGVDRWDVLGWGTPEEADQYMRGEQDILDRKPSCCKRKVTIDITFVELNEADDARDYTNWSFLASIWGGVMGMLPGHQSIIQPDYNNRFIDQDQRTTDLLRSDIESKLRPDDCIDEIIIRAHGNSEQVGGLLAQQIAVPGAPQHGLFEWLRTKRCSESSRIELQSCYAASGSKEMITNMAFVSGYRVTGNEGKFGVIGWGAEWTAYPDGSLHSN